MQAKDIMTTSPVCVKPTTIIADAIEVMHASDIRHITVVDREGRLVGILSERDIGALWHPTRGRMLDERVYARKVEDFMSLDPVSVESTTDIDEVIEIMLEHRVGAVPVLSADGVLSGIVSYVDILQAAQGKL